jgi:hypothetical protein
MRHQEDRAERGVGAAPGEEEAELVDRFHLEGLEDGGKVLAQLRVEAAERRAVGDVVRRRRRRERRRGERAGELFYRGVGRGELDAHGAPALGGRRRVLPQEEQAGDERQDGGGGRARGAGEPHRAARGGCGRGAAQRRRASADRRRGRRGSPERSWGCAEPIAAICQEPSDWISKA